jgi:uncharacterized protein (DUF1800 family)
MSVALLAASGAAASPLDLGPRAALHVLNRLGYGPRPGDIQRVLDRGLERYAEDQLDGGPDPEAETRVRGLGTLGYSISQVLALYNENNAVIGPIRNEFFAARIIRAVHAENQLVEVLVDFWFNHFNVYILDGFAQYSTMAYERDAIRPHVLGRFRDLLGATAAHPAMLFYLDNYLSTVSRVVNGRLVQGLNENYGRELMELHTVGVDAGYTQEHVFDAARCFTGWGIDNVRTGGNFLYRPANHDTASKSVFGLNVPAGGGKEDGDRLLDYLASHPATARFISRKLAQRFVADDPSPRLVERMAATFESTGGDLRQVMRSMIGSTDFWAEAFGSGKPKTPFEYVISVLRAANASVTQTGAIVNALSQMGMPIYLCVPPTGYSNRGLDWLNPSSQLNRMNFALDVASGAIAGTGVDARRVVRDAGGNPEEPRSAAAAISSAIFAKALSSQTLDAAGRVTTGGPVSVAARVLGSLLAGPEMQVR